MNLPQFAIAHRSVVLAFVAVLLCIGLVNFATMSRREDPEITVRDALIVTPWPGASAERVEELITDPIEDVIVEIAEVDTVKSKSMVGLSVIQVTVADAVVETEQVWDDLRAKVDAVGPLLPISAASPLVNSDFGDVFEIVLALYQFQPNGADAQIDYSPRQLEIFAERIEEEIELLDSVARVEFWGVQPERIYVEGDSADWAKLGVTLAELRDLFAARNITFPGGELDTTTSRYALNPSGEFSSVAQMRELVVGRVDGQLPVRLADLPITIERRYDEPPSSVTRVTSPEVSHAPAVVVGVSMKSGHNITAMDGAVDRVIERLRGTALPPDLALTRVNDLPRQVSERVNELQSNLLQGVLIVLAVGLFAMGWRPALIMAAAVPLSMIGAFAFVRYLGVELEQFSIASLIIALGMVVDNAIVVSDNTVRLMREGRSKAEAVVRGARELAVPILTSTLTTIAVFLPMLTMSGDVGEYISPLPIVVTTTLVMSYLVAMLVTPIMCLWLLQVDGDRSVRSRAMGWLDRYDAALKWCLDRPGKVLVATGVVFLSSLLMLPIIGSQFFPSGERDQLFVKVWLPESSPIEATVAVAREVEAILVEESPMPGQSQHRLQSAVTFVGTGGPRLMLTQEPEFDYPYLAFLVVNTTDPRHTRPYARAVRERVKNIAGARITVDTFMLGPPLRDPVAFRLSGPDRELIRRKAREMVLLFKETEGTMTPYSDWGAPAHQVDVEIDEYAANLAGVTNSDIALTTNAVLSGARLTVYREHDHQIPVVLRTVRQKREGLADLADIFVTGRHGKVPLNSIAKVVPSWQPAVIARRDGRPTVTVGARIEPEMLANRVAGRLRPKLDELLDSMPAGYSLEPDGELEETALAQAKVVRAVGIAVVLMVLVLVAQYNSVVKPLVILASVPMGLIGVLLGLLVTGWAMGFMATLGVLALGGIVINNAIVLVDFIESNLAGGASLRAAVASAGRMRMRPILLTTLTTIGGLLPLSLFGGALWAPMTNGMIFGLLMSTALTLFVIPSLYVVFVERLGMKAAR